MNEVNEYDILLDIFRFIRDYSTDTYSLPDVCRKLVKHLRSSGYDPTLTSIDRNSKLVQVEGYKYKILRQKDWSTCDVIMTV